MLIADSVAPIANSVFGAGAGCRARGARRPGWACIAYTLQIYFDFSGYSDMAVGLSLLFGVRLPYNFNSPYKAWNITEFWRRWHMTLSRFLRDYLYVPLGGNRHGRARRYVNLMLTMLLGGLWHGAVVDLRDLGRPARRLSGREPRLAVPAREARLAGSGAGAGGVLARGAGVALTLLCVMVGWVFFRAPDLASAQRDPREHVRLQRRSAVVRAGRLFARRCWRGSSGSH